MDFTSGNKERSLNCFPSLAVINNAAKNTFITFIILCTLYILSVMQQGYSILESLEMYLS